MVKVAYSDEERKDIIEAYDSIHHLFTDDRVEESSKYTENLGVLQKAIETHLDNVEFTTRMLNRADAMYNEFTITFPDLAKKDEAFANIIKTVQENEQYSAIAQRIKEGLQPEFLTSLEEKISPHDQPTPKNELSKEEINKLNKQYKKLTNNADRRKFVENALKNDTLVGKAKDFFIEQFNKGEIFAGKLDENTAIKIAGLLKINEVQDKNGEIKVSYWRKRRLKSQIEANQKRLAEDKVNKQREISLLKARICGSTDKSVEEMWAEYDNSKDKGERKHLKSMLKIVDTNYNRNKKAKNKNPKDSRCYDCTGDYLAAVTKTKEKIDNRIEWQNTVAGSAFFSKPFGKQLAARFNLLIHKNPEKEVQKLLSTMNTQQVMAMKKELNERLKGEKEGHRETAITRDKIKYDAHVKLLDSYIALADTVCANKNTEFEKAKTEIEKRPTKLKLSQKESISKYAAELEADRLKKLKEDPQIIAYNKLLEMASGNNDLRKKIESAANARQDKQITADRVFEEAMKQNGFSDKDIAVFKQEYVPDINKPVDAKPDDHKEEEKTLDDKAKEEKSSEEKSKEQTEEAKAEEKTEEKSEEPKAEEKTEEKSEEPKAEEKTEEPKTEEKAEEKEAANVTKNPVLHDGPVSEHTEQNHTSESLDSIFASSDYEKIEKSVAESATFKSKEDGHTVTIEKTDDNNYYVSAKTQDGKDDKAQVEDLVAVIKDMTKDGSKTIELGEVKSTEFLARVEAAAEKAGISISNLEEKRKELINKDPANEDKINKESERITAKDVVKDLGVDINSQEGQKYVASKLNDLTVIQTLTKEEYEQFKEWDNYKNLSSAEKDIFDNVHKLTTSEEYKNAPESVRNRNLSKIISRFQAAQNAYSAEDKKRKKNGTVVTRGNEIVKKAAKDIGGR